MSRNDVQQNGSEPVRRNKLKKHMTTHPMRVQDLANNPKMNNRLIESTTSIEEIEIKNPSHPHPQFLSTTVYDMPHEEERLIK
jgi:hypothetical protein